ncbi:MAG: hypothetical protein U0798_14215 [Gemmataceae bacterium]
MSHDPQELVKLYTGPLVYAESYQSLLKDSGIDSKVVGTELTAGLGTALPGTIELWVRQGDAKRAEEVILRQQGSESHGHKERQQFPHPTSDPKPGPAPHRKEPYINPNPGR